MAGGGRRHARQHWPQVASRVRIARFTTGDGAAFGVVEGECRRRRRRPDGPADRGPPVRAVPGGRRPVAARRRAAARAGAAEQGRRDRAQLRRARAGDGRRGRPRRAAGRVPQAVDVGDRPRRRRCSTRSASRSRSTTRASWPSSSAGCAARCRRSGSTDVVLGYTCANDVTARDLQKRRVAVGPRQGLRHVLPDRPVGRDRPRPVRPAPSPPRSTASCGRTAAPRR